MSNIIKKVSKRFFVLCNLKCTNCQPDVMFKVYCALIRSIMLYSIPAFCNLSEYLKNTLSRVFRIMGISGMTYASFFPFADINCRSLFVAINANADHPLRRMFEQKKGKSRSTRSLTLPFARTIGFEESLINLLSPTLGFCSLL